MFRELMPLLSERTVMMTLSRVDEHTLRVCVIPKRIKEETKETSGENALCSPLAVTGTVEELDREFVGQVSRYTSSIVTFGSNFAEVEAAHQAATKALKDENKKDLDRQRGKTSTKVNANAAGKPSSPAMKDGKPVFGSKDGGGIATAPTLFDAPEPAPTVSELAGNSSQAPDTAKVEPPRAEIQTVAPPPATGLAVGADAQSAFNYSD